MLVCSPPVFHIAVGWLYATPGTKMQTAWLCSMAYDHPSSSWSHSRSFQWASGLEIGLAMTGSLSGGPPSTPWLTWLCGMEQCLVKTILRVEEHCQSRKKEVFFQDKLVRGFIHASFTKTNLPSQRWTSLLASPGLHLTIRWPGAGQSWKLDSSEKMTLSSPLWSSPYGFLQTSA